MKRGLFHDYFVIDFSEVRNKNPKLKIETAYRKRFFYFQKGNGLLVFKKALKLYDDYEEYPVGSVELPGCGMLLMML